MQLGKPGEERNTENSIQRNPEPNFSAVEPRRKFKEDDHCKQILHDSRFESIPAKVFAEKYFEKRN